MSNEKTPDFPQKKEKTAGQKAGIGISTGLKVASIFMQAGVQKNNIDAALISLSVQREEREGRHQTNLRLLRKQANRAIAGKKEAFISGGVKLEGSALTVINDTLMDLLKAEMNKQTELDAMNMQSAAQEASLQSQRGNIDTVAAMNAATSILGAAGELS